MIKDALEKQDRAICDARVGSKEEQREVEARIVASAIKEAAADVPQYEKTQRYNEYRLQKGTDRIPVKFV